MNTDNSQYMNTDDNQDNELANTFGAISNALREIDKQLKKNNEDNQRTREDNQKTRDAVRGVQHGLDDLRDDVHNEIDGIKDSQYLEPYQASEVQEAAQTRVAKILNDWCSDNNVDSDVIFVKYYGKFVRALHGDAKKVGLEIGKIIYTPKRNYELLLEFIGSWYPKRGVKGQMEHYDKREAIRASNNA